MSQQTQSNANDRLDLLWGAEAIGKYLGRTPRQAFEALTKGELPARKVNGRWVASKDRLKAFFEIEGGHFAD